jgi:hypothetical protein
MRGSGSIIRWLERGGWLERVEQVAAGRPLLRPWVAGGLLVACAVALLTGQPLVGVSALWFSGFIALCMADVERPQWRKYVAAYLAFGVLLVLFRVAAEFLLSERKPALLVPAGIAALAVRLLVWRVARAAGTQVQKEGSIGSYQVHSGKIALDLAKVFLLLVLLRLVPLALSLPLFPRSEPEHLYEPPRLCRADHLSDKIAEMDPPTVTQVFYRRNAIPKLEAMRTEVQFYLMEHGHLPGLYRYSDGTVVRATNGPPTQVHGNSILPQGTPLPDPASPVLPASTHQYGQCMDGFGRLFAQKAPLASGAFVTWEDIWGAITNKQFMNHYTRDLRVSMPDLSGDRSGPRNFVYAAPVGGCGGETYMYILAVFGNGCRLPAGTGYAVLECRNPANTGKEKIAATWERWGGEYKDEVSTVDQLVLSYYGADTGLSAPDLGTSVGRQAMANHVFVPLDLASDDLDKVSQALKDLRRLGWKL